MLEDRVLVPARPPTSSIIWGGSHLLSDPVSSPDPFTS